MSNRRKLRRRQHSCAGWQQIGATRPEPDVSRHWGLPNVIYGPAVLFTARHGDQAWQQIGGSDGDRALHRAGRP